MKKDAFLLVILLAIALLISPIRDLSCAETIKPKSLEGIEFFTGFGWGRLLAKKNYHLTPLMVNFDFNLKPLIQKLNFKPRQLFQFQIEPFISFVSSPDNNIETGTSFAFKLGILPQTSKFQPYIKAGLGMVYMTQHTREQSTQFNFIEQGGLGMHYFFRKNTAFTLEGRFRHLSNAGIDHPNHGINTYFAVAGITYQF
jgi:hypothetical protein